VRPVTPLTLVRDQSHSGGEPIVVIAPTELAGIRALSLIGADQLRRAGLNVDLQEMEFGAVVKRRTSQSPPDKGGWNVFFTLIDRSIPNIHPFGNPALRADGKSGYDGWPDCLRIEELRRAWLDAGDLHEQRRIAAELQMQVWQDLPFIPMGEYWQTTAYRKGLTGIIPGCFTVFYNVKRAYRTPLGCAGRGCCRRVAPPRWCGFAHAPRPAGRRIRTHGPT
jgi:peptide/nickel transport system substrate-binding protein